MIWNICCDSTVWPRWKLQASITWGCMWARTCGRHQRRRRLNDVSRGQTDSKTSSAVNTSIKRRRTHLFPLPVDAPPSPRGRRDSTLRLQKAAQIGTLPQFCVITATCLLYIKLPLVSICICICTYIYYICILMTSCFTIMSKQINKVHMVQKQVCFALHGLQEATFTRHATLHRLFTREEEIKIYE